MNIDSGDLLWTDVYGPESSSDLVGNTQGVRRLRCWLIEWKEKVDREERKLRKLLKRQIKKNEMSISGN